jgi:hypothetical protein
MKQGLPFTNVATTCCFMHCSSVVIGSHWLVEQARLVHHLHEENQETINQQSNNCMTA